MPTLNDLLNKLPPETRTLLTDVWNGLSDSDKTTLVKSLSAFPTDSGMTKNLIKLAARQYQTISSEKHHVAIVGPANVGKSTFYNQLIHKKEDQALVSPVPGTTHVNQTADIGLFNIIDTPGADSIGQVGETERQYAMTAARQADFLIIMFDAIQGIKQNELTLFRQLASLGKPYLVVLNKIDLVKKETDRIITAAANNLELPAHQIVPICAQNGKSISDVVMAIAITEPGLITALGKALPEYRWMLAWRTIMSSATLSAAIALTPLPVLDFGPLVLTQTMMVLSLAKIYNYKLNLARARELVLSFGLGLLGRTLFMELSKVAGIPGWILSAAIAVSITVVIGYATVLLFDKGQKLSGKELRQLTNHLTHYITEHLKTFGNKKPGKKTLQETIFKTLEESGIDQQLHDR